MAHDVFPVERLLEHHQVEIVHRYQCIGVVHSVRVVRIGHQRRVGERVAHCVHVVDIFARHDLQLDLTIPLGERAAHLLDQMRR